MAAARRVLEDSGSALDAVEQGIRPVEADERVKTVGRGGAPNLLGEVECAAAIMDGATLQAGAVGALRGYLHAITVARRVMEHLPHVFLVGSGAERFAREIDAETAELLTDRVKERHERWLAKRIRSEDRDKWPDVALARYALDSSRDYVSRGTTILLARDAEGNIAAGTSTSGWPESYPGRIGDTPIIGAGLYADGHYGVCAR
jgi:L-asparaginase